MSKYHRIVMVENGQLKAGLYDPATESIEIDGVTYGMEKLPQTIGAFWVEDHKPIDLPDGLQIVPHTDECGYVINYQIVAPGADISGRGEERDIGLGDIDTLWMALSIASLYLAARRADESWANLMARFWQTRGRIVDHSRLALQREERICESEKKIRL